MSRISAIGQSYVNKISFKADENKPKTEEQTPIENEGMSQNTKIGIGVGAALALVALGVAGYHGKLGKGIQKMLGNGEKAVENAANKGADALENGEKKAAEALGTAEKAVEKTEKNSSEIITAAEKESSEALGTAEKTVEKTEKNSSEVFNAAEKKSSEALGTAEKTVEKTEKNSSEGVTSTEKEAPSPGETLEKSNTESTSKAVEAEISEEAEEIRIFTKEELNELINTTEEKINSVEKEFGFANGVFKNEEAKEQSYKAIYDYMGSLNLGEPNSSNVEFYDKFLDRIMKGYSSVMKKEGEYGEFTMGRAYVKLIKGDINAAEKFLMEGMEFADRSDKFLAYDIMNNIAKAQNNPEKAVRFFADNVKDDIEASKKLIDYLQNADVKELLAKDSSTLPPNDRYKVEGIVSQTAMYKGTFETYIENFKSVYGEKNPEIISMKNVLNEMNKHVNFLNN